MPATVNTDINGWCPTCVEWTVRGRREQCTWCDTQLTDGPDAGGGLVPLPQRVLRALVRDALDRMGEDLHEERAARERAASEARDARTRQRAATAAKRAATRRANGTRPGHGPTAVTEDLIREAHELYSVGTNDRGRPLSVRQVAAIILSRTKYKSAASCAESLHQAWKARGWPLRDRIEAARAAHLVHGELVGTKDWTTPEAKARKNAYRHARRRRVECTSLTNAGEPCQHFAQDGKDKCFVHDPDRRVEVEAKLAAMRAKRRVQVTTTEGAADVSRDHREGHDDERPPEALAWLRGGARNEAT